MIGLLASLAAASEVPSEPDEPEPLRTTNSGIGIGIAHLGAQGPAGSGHLFGLQLEYRGEAVVSRSLQLNMMLSTAFTRPRNTPAMFDWGLRHAAWTTRAIGNVTEWAGDGSEDTEALRWMGAFFGYTFLGMSYLVVPVAWVLSPFASIGHVIGGPTLSWHSDSVAPNGWVEVGLGGILYGDPVTDLPQVGFGPLLGVGALVGKQSVGLRLLWSPPGAHTQLLTEERGTVLSGAFVVGL